MANNNNKDKCNVPHLRFPEFSGEWEMSSIGEQFELYSGNTPSRMNKNQFDGSINWITSGELKEHYISDTKEKISEEAAKNNSLKLLPVGTFVIAIYGLEANGVRGTCSITTRESTISQACMAFTSKMDIQNEFLYSWYKKHGNIIGIKYAQGTKQQNLSYDIIERFNISYPCMEEQKKLIRFISLIDQRIATQNKIIEKLQSLIKGIAQHCIKESTSGNTYVKLGDICQITTGKLDANAQVDNGIYPFFTCAEQPFKIDSFAFDTEALLISGNGANLGYINYYHGKFNAYQRTYVLDIFSENIQYIKWALKVLLPKRIAIEKSSSNTPYIVLSTLSDLRLPIPNKSIQCHIAKLMQSLERKLSSQIALNGSYNRLKQYLLRQMFI
ncbi:restriction endonuclease subunit S [Bacteroides ovatus]|uniref:restriction endonuclease subunit S n=1 Tax=Bacteroides ovatus TaxID=28116 RepID=UPI000AC5153B|nr:restriction endonuclease subunit S [Bacteroides ovatus]